MAEVELESEDQAVVLPEWVREDVTADPRYANSSLVTPDGESTSALLKLIQNFDGSLVMMAREVFRD